MTNKSSVFIRGNEIEISCESKKVFRGLISSPTCPIENTRVQPKSLIMINQNQNKQAKSIGFIVKH